MKKTSIIIGFCALLISASVYAYTASKQATVTYQTHIVSGEARGHKEVAAHVRKEAAAMQGLGFRLVDVEMTQVPFGPNDFHLAYVATFERANP